MEDAGSGVGRSRRPALFLSSFSPMMNKGSEPALPVTPIQGPAQAWQGPRFFRPGRAGGAILTQGRCPEDVLSSLPRFLPPPPERGPYNGTGQEPQDRQCLPPAADRAPHGRALADGCRGGRPDATASG